MMFRRLGCCLLAVLLPLLAAAAHDPLLQEGIALLNAGKVEAAIAALHDAARSAYLRARHVAGVLQDSDQLRNATFEQWSRLGRRSLFDLIAAENEHYQLRIAYINALHDGFSASAQMRNASSGLLPWIAPELAGVPAR